MNSIHAIAPAYLFVGTYETTREQALAFLQKYFCDKESGCKACRTCELIAKKQHPSMLWLNPENLYTLDDLTPIFHKISFALGRNEHYFFILDSADFLSTACANSLLKPLEEPPPGYHFILIAQTLHTILPTIQSRCIVQTFFSHSAIHNDQFLTHFKNISQPNPLEFLKTLESLKLSERVSLEMLDHLFSFWLQQYKIAQQEPLSEQKQRAEHAIQTLKAAQERPLMPGSAKIFWKDLFLQFYCLKACN